MYIINKNVPLPTGTHGRKAIYPFLDMQVGDSFFVETETTDIYKRVQNSILGAARNRSNIRKEKIPDAKFLTKKVEGGIRCWRYE